MEILDGYISPFGMDLDKVKLVNLISSTPVDDAVAMHVFYMHMIMEIFKQNFSQKGVWSIGVIIPRSYKTVSIC